MSYAIAVELSKNAKLGPVSATYVSQSSCPSSCPHYHNGCYAEYGPLGILTRRLSRFDASPTTLARAEAVAILRLRKKLPLRLHVVGDARTSAAARILARAARLHGAPVWTYTHAHSRVPRSDWGTISVLASCESLLQVCEAQARGYATALVVPSFTTHKLHNYKGVRLLPCPAQTRGVTCASCRLCWDDSRLRARNITIGFTPHGAGRKRVSLTLVKECSWLSR